MDILREITDDELNYVIERLKENLPRCIKNLNYILGARRSRALAKNFVGISDKLLPDFFVHRTGRKENCTIFGITGKGDRTVWFFTFQENLEELKECLENTKLIPWNEKILFVTLHKEHTWPLLDVIERRGHNMSFNEESGYYQLPREEALKFETECPPGVYLRSLEEADAEFCNSLWVWKDEVSENFIRSMILLHGGYGLIDKETDELLAFGTINDHLAIGILNTVEKARGHHYGALVTKLIAVKIVNELGMDPTCYINDFNTVSIKLFAKLGFRRIGDCNWILLLPKPTLETNF